MDELKYALLNSSLLDWPAVESFLRPAGPIHLLYCDPPWGFGNVKYWNTMAKDTSTEFTALIKGIARIYNEFVSGPFYMEMGLKWTEMVIGWLEQEGLTVFQTYQAWYNNGSLPYNIIYGAKDPQFPWKKEGFPGDLRTWHIMKWGIERDSNPGDTVLDCCIGLGGTLKAAHKTGRGCLGIEMNPERFASTLALARKYKLVG